LQEKEHRPSSPPTNSDGGRGEVANARAQRPILPRAVRFGREYWLSRCIGYRVESPTGRIGVVESAGFWTRYDCPDFLVVRTGHLRPRRATVPVTDVVQIEPNRQSIQITYAIGKERAGAARQLWRRQSSTAKELWRRVRHSPHPVSS
jgi:hypothetical protein